MSLPQQRNLGLDGAAGSDEFEDIRVNSRSSPAHAVISAEELSSAFAQMGGHREGGSTFAGVPNSEVRRPSS